MNAATVAKHFEMPATAPAFCDDPLCMACCAGTCTRAAAPAALPPLSDDERRRLQWALWDLELAGRVLRGGGR